MTRDEAIEKYVKATYSETRRTTGQTAVLYGNAAAKIDGYVALGMLKLDEPESAGAQFWKLLRARLPIDQAQWIANDLANSNLKIVEK